MISHIANFFVSLLTRLWKQRCSVLECTSSLSLLYFLTFPSSSPRYPFSYLTSPPPHTSLTCTPHFTAFLSSLFSYFISPPLFFPFICWSPSPPAPFYPTFLSSTGLQTAERLSTKAFYSSPHTAPSIAPTDYSPRHSAMAHTCVRTHKYSLDSTLKNWHTHAPDKLVNNLLPENSAWILN